MMANDFTPKNAAIFFCEKCRFKCSKKSDWERHIVTSKHHRLTNANDFTPKNALSHYLVCECGKTYKHISSLCKHKKQCNFQPSVAQCNKLEMDDFKITPKMFYDLLQQNNELQKNVIELSSKIGTNNSHNTNCNNKTFNLQFFLNEQCKDALNISDFVNQLQVTINDLEETSRIGFAEGVSKVFIKGLKELDIYKRPLHCSDAKRETLYIKDENQWTKENEEKNILVKAIKQVANKNIKQIPEWTKTNPQYLDPESRQNDKYMKIVSESMPGGTKEETNKNYDKIVKNVIKETTIQKENINIT
jgi:ferritin